MVFDNSNWHFTVSGTFHRICQRLVPFKYHAKTTNQVWKAENLSLGRESSVKVKEDVKNIDLNKEHALKSFSSC